MNWIFAGYTGSKNPVQTKKKKIQFIKLEISNWRISKIKCRWERLDIKCEIFRCNIIKFH
jgi:hypothetical protein